MKRNQFIKKMLLSAGGLITIPFFSKLKGATETTPKTNEITEQIGFNHLPLENTNIMENIVLHKANTRGHANHGWLNSYHSFSFANYYNPERMNFGALRVLNDDTVAAGMGFGTHPHQNMEIISIPLEGDLEHKDSMGNVTVIKNGDIQVMSAGSGIQHSEYNKNKDRLTKFLQIWVIPNKNNVTPRYDQITLNLKDRVNKLQQILSPNPDDSGVWIHQNAWFHLGQFDNNTSFQYELKDKSCGVYIFVLSGKFNVNNSIALENRDGLGIWDINTIDFKTISDKSEVLIMEVPIKI